MMSFAKKNLLPRSLFTGITQTCEIFGNAATFIGRSVVDYQPEIAFDSEVIYRFRSSHQHDCCLEHLQDFAQTAAAAQCQALVFGAWAKSMSGHSSSRVIDALVNLRGSFPQLAALYLGDINFEEWEMSWIVQSDLAPLLSAFPDLQLLRTRGSKNLQLNSHTTSSLRGLILESGGMSASLIQSLLKIDWSALEYLEIWLGTEEYGGSVTLADLQPVLQGDLFPRLKHLGLRNFDNADQLACALTDAPVMQQLEVLDLSLGTLSDVGARAILGWQAPLKHLCLHHNYISADLGQQLQQLAMSVDLSNPPNFEDGLECRYVAVGE